MTPLLHRIYEGCSNINFSLVLFGTNHAMCAQNQLVLIEWSLNRNMGKNLTYNFPDLCTVYISL